MAEALGEDALYNTYMAIFNRGRETLNTKLYNGEYYIQDVDINDKSLLTK